MYQLCDGIKFLKSLPDNSVDGIFMDPPWGSGPAIKGQKIWKKLIRHVANECPRILKPRARVLIWVGSRMLSDTIKAVGGGLRVQTSSSLQVHPSPLHRMLFLRSRSDFVLLATRRKNVLPKRKVHSSSVHEAVYWQERYSSSLRSTYRNCFKATSSFFQARRIHHRSFCWQRHDWLRVS